MSKPRKVKVKFQVTVQEGGYGWDYDTQADASAEMEMDISAIAYLDCGNILENLLKPAYEEHVCKFVEKQLKKEQEEE